MEFGGLGYAQQPTHVPSSQNNSPINLNNWFDITVYIILPICMVLFYFLWRRQIKKDKDNNENKK
ncbi:MAG: hypothetical protein AUK33_11315 [Flavobacteriaceae bacterium CG2_30_34_30]|nr:MAG: hypothetical protein AUK33_11315 [Flavobacteriaceae bacterium CG2_30_34_30]